MLKKNEAFSIISTTKILIKIIERFLKIEHFIKEQNI